MDYKVLLCTLLFFECSSSETIQISLCDGESHDLVCAGGKTIVTSNVFYGKSKELQCPYKLSTAHDTSLCEISSASSTVHKICDGRSWCNLLADAPLFGKDCIDVMKVLKIEYHCTRNYMLHLSNTNRNDYCQKFELNGQVLPESPLGKIVYTPCPNNPALKSYWQCGVWPTQWYMRFDLDKCESQGQHKETKLLNGTNPLGDINLEEEDLFGNGAIGISDFDFEIDIMKKPRESHGSDDKKSEDSVESEIIKVDNGEDTSDNGSKDIAIIDLLAQVDDIMDTNKNESYDKDVVEEDVKESEETDDLVPKVGDIIEKEINETRKSLENAHFNDTNVSDVNDNDDEDSVQQTDTSNKTNILKRHIRSVNTTAHNSHPSIEVTIDPASHNAQDLILKLESPSSPSREYLNMTEDAFKSISDGKNITFKLVLYDDIPQLMYHHFEQNPKKVYTIEDKDVTKHLISKIIALSTDPPIDAHKDHKNIAYFLSHVENPGTDAVYCVFWDYDKSEEEGWWSEEGCKAQSVSTSGTLCRCDRLSHYAVIVHRARHAEEPARVLGTPVEVFVLVFCLTIVVVVVGVLIWKLIKYNEEARRQHPYYSLTENLIT